MKIYLSDAAFCGAWCSENELKYEVNNWFEKSSLQFFYTGKLINEFGYKDCNEIEASGHFIPVFKTDIVALKKQYVSLFHPKEVENEIQMIMEYNDKHSNSPSYDVAFSIFCEEHEDIYDDYWNYERNQLLKDAEKWCKKNGIAYYTPNDLERKLNLNDTLLFGYGGECSDGKGGWTKFDFWFCKKDFKFMDLGDIKVKFGYKTEDEIVSSGLFVLFPRINADVIEGNYISDSSGTKTEDEVRRFMSDNQNYSYEEALMFLSGNSEIMCKNWMLYKETQIIKHAEQWAIKNNIPYYIPKNRPDHLGSQFKVNQSTIF